MSMALLTEGPRASVLFTQAQEDSPDPYVYGLRANTSLYLTFRRNESP